MNDMSASPRHRRGAAPVGRLDELDPVEAGAVLYLRLWCEGAPARARIERDFSDLLGPVHGPEALNSLDRLCELCARHGRRPLMRHHVTCACLGGDESCFANFIATAAEGAREDAMWIATAMIRADMAPCLVGLAETLGLALKRMACRASPAADRTLH